MPHSKPLKVALQVASVAAAAAVVVAALTLASGPRGEPPERAAEPRREPAAQSAGELPGARAFSPELKGRLDAALAAQGPDYEPRTHHLLPDGSPRFTNRLILESSPYLLQHAHNPVNWYSWGDEAFETARRLDRPVLLSIGYSTCYWCHVMERESFEDLEIARYMNENYVAIKVDREERPDVDSVYMSAVQALTGRGGWPMTTWLTPDRVPYFGGTYFPPRDGVRGSRTGFLTLLENLKQTYERAPEGVARQTERIAAAIESRAAPDVGEDVPGARALKAAFRAFDRSFDDDHGGWGRRMKFPRPSTLEFLMRYVRRTGDERAREMITRTLDAMASGGLYDHVAGGFHRYTTDRRWRVPHFEKMLYDNAQLASVYVAAFRLTGERRYARVAVATLDYLAREMSDPAGGFYSATDAESGGHEGASYVWTPARMRAVLGPEDGPLIADFYGVTAGGNFERGTTVLHTEQWPAAFADARGLDPEAFAARLADARRRLLEARARREQPHTDTKVLAAWNGLAVSAFARAGLVLGEPRYTERAERAAAFVLAELRTSDGLKRSWRKGDVRHDGTLEDYALFTAGLLDLFEAAQDLRWLDAALTLQREQDARFWDGEDGAYFMTAAGGERLPAREKPYEDYAVPSGNSTAALNLLRLSEWTGDDAYRERAERLLAFMEHVLERAPTAAPRLAAALDFYRDRPKEVVVVHPPEPGPACAARLEALLERYRATFLPNAVLVIAGEGEALARARERIPYLERKRALGEKTTAYVCERFVCELPTSDPEVFARQIAKVREL